MRRVSAVATCTHPDVLWITPEPPAHQVVCFDGYLLQLVMEHQRQKQEQEQRRRQGHRVGRPRQRRRRAAVVGVAARGRATAAWPRGDPRQRHTQLRRRVRRAVHHGVMRASCRGERPPRHVSASGANDADAALMSP